jgi:hypothetical protein
MGVEDQSGTIMKLNTQQKDASTRIKEMLTKHKVTEPETDKVDYKE